MELGQEQLSGRPAARARRVFHRVRVVAEPGAGEALERANALACRLRATRTGASRTVAAVQDAFDVPSPAPSIGGDRAVRGSRGRQPAGVRRRALRGGAFGARAASDGIDGCVARFRADSSSERCARPPRLAWSLRRDAFSAVNTAWLRDGALVLVGRTIARSATRSICCSSAPAPRALLSARVLVAAAPAAAARVIEDFVSLHGDAASPTPLPRSAWARTRACATSGCSEKSASAFHIATCGVRVGRDGRYSNVTFRSARASRAIT